MITFTPDRQQNAFIDRMEQLILNDHEESYRPIPTGFDVVEIRDKSRKLETPVRMLTSLLKSSLNGGEVDKSVFQSASANDWNKMLKLADKSSVTGLVWDSLQGLEQVNIPADALLETYAYVQATEENYARQEKALASLTEKFNQRGLDMVQLKGVGLSMNYPVPQHRHGGDIDIFLIDRNNPGQQDTWSNINKMLIDEGYEVEDYKRKTNKHSEFKYDGFNIENHNYFANKNTITEAGKVDEYLHKVLNPRLQRLPDGSKILVPSREFNAVFLPQHAFQHFIFSGINFHHLTDWAAHLRQNDFQFPEELKGTKLEQFTYALTNLANDYLGTNVDAPKNEEYEMKILNKMVNPEIEPIPEDYNRLQTVWFKAKRFYKRSKNTKQYTDKSVFFMFKNAILAKIEKPRTLFIK